jgi:hypothetical protein
MSVWNLASTLRRMRDARWESGFGCCFWGRNDTCLAGDEAPLAIDFHGDEFVAE